MADTLGEWLAVGSEVTQGDRQRAGEALQALGVPELLDALAMAERIIRFGSSFHSIARFFADGSEEQDFLLSLLDPSPQQPH